MIHVFNILPGDNPERFIECPPARDICRSLPGCKTEFASNDYRWDKHTLQVEWNIVSLKKEPELESNVDLWHRIFTGIDKRVNEDFDDEENVIVRIVATRGRVSTLAAIVESRNKWLSKLDELQYTEESKELARKWSTIYVPLFREKPIFDDERRPGDTRKSRSIFVRWAEL